MPYFIFIYPPTKILFLLIVNGGWTSWSVCECTQKCGGGTCTKTRSCANPKPKNGGDRCMGDDKQVTKCNTKACPSKRFILFIRFVNSLNIRKIH